jgi:hypothetical protein
MHIPIHSVSNLQVAPIEKGFPLEIGILCFFHPHHLQNDSGQ